MTQVLVLDASGTLVGSFVGAPSLGGFASGGFDVVYDRPNGDVWLRVTQTVTAVPEPGVWRLMVAGLAGLAWPARQRGRSAVDGEVP